MKKHFYILLFLLCAISYQSQASRCFRFHVSIGLAGNQKIDGYIYHCTVDKPFDNRHESFENYAWRELSFPSRIYTEIKSLLVDNQSEIDFYPDGSMMRVDIDEIYSIELIDFIEYNPGERLLKLTIQEYSMLDNPPLAIHKCDKIRLLSHCRIILISWSENEDLEKRGEEINKTIDRLIMRGRNVYQYFRKLRSELIEYDILMVPFCN